MGPALPRREYRLPIWGWCRGSTRPADLHLEKCQGRREIGPVGCRMSVGQFVHVVQFTAADYTCLWRPVCGPASRLSTRWRSSEMTPCCSAMTTSRVPRLAWSKSNSGSIVLLCHDSASAASIFQPGGGLRQIRLTNSEQLRREPPGRPAICSKLDFTQNPGKVMDDITFVRSHWWLVSEGFSLSTANSDVQKLPATLYHRIADSLADAA